MMKNSTIILLSFFVQSILLFSSCIKENTKDFIEVRELDNSGQYKLLDVPFHPEKTAIVVVDMWGAGGLGYFNPDSSFVGTTEGYIYSGNISKNINVLLASARALDMTVIHTPSDQTSFYESHSVRKNVKALAKQAYPWTEKLQWNDEQKKIPYGKWHGYEYEYMYPGMDWHNNRPGTEVFGQNPHIVLHKNDFMTDDPDEMWDIIKSKDINTLIYVGGSTNMCLAGRPFGLLNMKQYGMNVFLDRNYNHVMHRIPHGWNGDIDNPKYGSEYTNRQNSKKVIRYFEENICCTLDGEDVIRLAKKKNLTVNVLQPAIEQSFSDINNLTINFQPQHIEIPKEVVVDCGWPFTKQVAELVYGWQKLKIKDTYRTEFDPLKGAGIRTSRNDHWSILSPKGKYKVSLSGSKKGKVLIQDNIVEIGDSKENWEIQRDVSNDNGTIDMKFLSDDLLLEYVKIVRVSDL